MKIYDMYAMQLYMETLGWRSGADSEDQRCPEHRCFGPTAVDRNPCCQECATTWAFLGFTNFVLMSQQRSVYLETSIIATHENTHC